MLKDISQIPTYKSGVMQATAHRILSRIKTDYLVQYRLTAMQWFAIGFIYEAGPSGIRLNDLMRILDTTMPFITTTIAMLESKGIVHKTTHPDDSRIKIATLEPGYLPTVKKIEQGLRRELHATLHDNDNISREELATYISVLYKINKR